jgi:hypothetical protein
MRVFSTLGVLFALATLLQAPAAYAGGPTDPDWNGGHTCEQVHDCQGVGHDSHGEGKGYGHNHDLDPSVPPPFTIARPGNDHGAYIAQIGSGGAATIRQSSNTQYARIDQDGDHDRADIAQSGVGAHYATIAQDGDFNALDLTQSGAGAQVALLQQTGNGNSMLLDQQGGSVSSGVLAQQLGDNNTLALAQSGDNNQASLVQNGSGNVMSASQTGGNNQLAWTQNGDNLSGMTIDQTGGQALAVMQTR